MILFGLNLSFKFIFFYFTIIKGKKSNAEILTLTLKTKNRFNSKTNSWPFTWTVKLPCHHLQPAFI